MVDFNTLLKKDQTRVSPFLIEADLQTNGSWWSGRGPARKGV